MTASKATFLAALGNRFFSAWYIIASSVLFAISPLRLRHEDNVGNTSLFNTVLSDEASLSELNNLIWGTIMNQSENECKFS
jgi:predicted secreted protein